METNLSSGTSKTKTSSRCVHRGYWDYLRRTIQHVPLNILFGHEPLASSALLNINARKGRCQLGKCSCFIILAEKIGSTKIFQYNIHPRSFNTFAGAFPSISSTNTSLHQQTFGPRLHRADRHPKCFPAGRPARKSSPLKQRKTFFRPRSRGFVQPNGGGEASERCDFRLKSCTIQVHQLLNHTPWVETLVKKS